MDIRTENILARDEMSDDMFNAMMEKGMTQAKAEQGLSLDDAFDALECATGYGEGLSG